MGQSQDATDDDLLLPLDYGVRGALRIYFYRLLIMLGVSLVAGAFFLSLIAIIGWWPRSAPVLALLVLVLAAILAGLRSTITPERRRALLHTLSERALLGTHTGWRDLGVSALIAVCLGAVLLVIEALSRGRYPVFTAAVNLPSTFWLAFAAGAALLCLILAGISAWLAQARS